MQKAATHTMDRLALNGHFYELRKKLALLETLAAAQAMDELENAPPDTEAWAAIDDLVSEVRAALRLRFSAQTSATVEVDDTDVA